MSDKHSDFDALLAEIEADSAGSIELAEAGTWVAENFYAEDGWTIKTARLRKGFSQKQLAEKLGTSQPHIANLEAGRNDPMLSTAHKLCEVLEIPLGELPEMLERQRAKTEEKAKK